MLWQIASGIRAKTLVYRFTGPPERWRVESRTAREAWIRASQSSIALLFAADGQRRHRFLRFLRSGFLGYFLVREDKWIGYGWCATPDSGRPPHLPRWAGGVGAYWIFECCVRHGACPEGSCQQLLAHLVTFAFVRESSPLLLCEMQPENLTWRQAALQAGFTPLGVLSAYRLWFPGVGAIALGGIWRRDVVHAPEIAALESMLRH